MELWDEEMRTDVHRVGIYTLPEMELPFAEMAAVVDEIERVAYEVIGRDKFLVTLGGEHSITPPLVVGRRAEASEALRAADRRPRGHARRLHGDAAQPCVRHAARRCAYARITQVGIRSLSTEEAEAMRAPRHDRLLGRRHAAAIPGWIDRVVESLREDVYISIDVDGLDPAIMPATGTPEPGGLSWADVTGLLRATAERRNVVAADVVELSPIPGMIAPNFLCAKLVYKLLSYRFAADPRSKRL